MKRIFITFLCIVISSCAPTDAEIQANNELIDRNISTTTSTTTTSSTTTTIIAKVNSSSNQSSNCQSWANSTMDNLATYQYISSSISNDSYDAAYGYISLYEYQNNLEYYEIRLKSLETSQKRLSPNSENITSHNYILDAISTSISSVSFTIVGLELDDSSYIELAADLTLLANESVKKSTQTLKNC